MGVIFTLFARFYFILGEISMWKSNPYDFINENGNRLVKITPTCKGLANIFVKFSPSKNNHVYSIQQPWLYRHRLT